VARIIEEVEGCSSTKAKQHILMKNEDNLLLQKVLLYTYDPNKKYGVSEKYLEKLPYDENDDKTSYNNLWSLLDKLAVSNINDNLRDELRRHINYYHDDKVRELIKRIVGKNLKCNINIKMINKVWADLIPTSDGTRKIAPMLGSKLELDKVPNGIKYATEKYDGCRCLAFIEDGIVELYSRQGKKYEGCKEIEEELLSLGINNVMLDGEILAINCDYDNVYKETTKRLKNKKENKTGLYFMVFDYIEKDEYDKLKGIYSYRERREKLDSIEQTEHIKVAPLLVATENMDEIMDLLDEYRDKGAEGLMVSLDKPYEFKRSKTLLKLKVMSTIDLRVIGFEEGTNKNKGRLGAVLVKYKGNIVKVGSGFKENDRIEIWNNQEKYLGKILEISYFEETTNKEGTYSLRFPIAKRWRFDKDEESYE
jgi:DNA ligase-1